MEFPVVSDELREAYLSTHFHVLGPCLFTLRIGEPSQKIASLYLDHKVSSAAFLTAWNPYSGLTGQRVNERAQRQLEKKLNKLSCNVLPGFGEDVSGKWPGEQSALALGISWDAATQVGKEFRQNAIVWIGANYIPELIFLRD